MEYILAKDKQLFEKKLELGKVSPELIAFIEKEGEIWTHGEYYGGGLVEITYSELVNLRDNSLLVKGTQYRITDYVTTTALSNTLSAGNVFDVIVVADSENTLNENARAALHEGDLYFSECNINAWLIKYCLDNDTTRFAWADTTNGKGVIYWMKDEWDNECPYDFKNIQYKPNSSHIYFVNNDYRSRYYYTFNADTDYNYIVYRPTVSDGSLHGQSYYIYNNTIKSYYISNKMQLPFIILFGQYNYNNKFGIDCNNITISGGKCHNNNFNPLCYNINLREVSSNNNFGSGCCNIKIYINGCSNNFRNGCYSITLFAESNNNIFGSGCGDITFKEVSYNNRFGNGCHNIQQVLCNNIFEDNVANITTTNTNLCIKNSTFKTACKNLTFNNKSLDFVEVDRWILNVNINPNKTGDVVWHVYRDSNNVIKQGVNPFSEVDLMTTTDVNNLL